MALSDDKIQKLQNIADKQLKQENYESYDVEMQKCINCGRDIPIDSVICPYCGTDIKFTTNSLVRKCPFCAMEIPEEAKVCPHCKHMIGFMNLQDMVCPHCGSRNLVVTEREEKDKFGPGMKVLMIVLIFTVIGIVVDIILLIWHAVTASSNTKTYIKCMDCNKLFKYDPERTKKA